MKEEEGGEVWPGWEVAVPSVRGRYWACAAAQSEGSSTRGMESHAWEARHGRAQDAASRYTPARVTTS